MVAAKNVSSGYKHCRNVILSEAKLQRSGRSPRGQAFNLGSVLDTPAKTGNNQRCFASLNMTAVCDALQTALFAADVRAWVGERRFYPGYFAVEVAGGFQFYSLTQVANNQSIAATKIAAIRNRHAYTSKSWICARFAALA